MFSACSLLGVPANTSPVAALSSANLETACTSKSNPPTQVWLACTVYSQATGVCKDVASGHAVDLQLVQLVNAFSPDPILSTIGGLSVAAANLAATKWCSAEGYNVPVPAPSPRPAKA
jgi:hypothetical protein